MKITVKAHPRSKRSEIKKLAENNYEVWFNVAPVQGKANEKIVEMLAGYFEIAKRRVVLLSGEKGKIKTFKIYEQ